MRTYKCWPPKLRMACRLVRDWLLPAGMPSWQLKKSQPQLLAQLFLIFWYAFDGEHQLLQIFFDAPDSLDAVDHTSGTPRPDNSKCHYVDP